MLKNLGRLYLSAVADPLAKRMEFLPEDECYRVFGGVPSASFWRGEHLRAEFIFSGSRSYYEMSSYMGAYRRILEASERGEDYVEFDVGDLGFTCIARLWELKRLQEEAARQGREFLAKYMDLRLSFESFSDFMRNMGAEPPATPEDLGKMIRSALNP